MKISSRRLGWAAALGLLAGCSTYRISGNYVRSDGGLGVSGQGAILNPYILPTPQEEADALWIGTSTASVKRESFSEEDLKARYYYDLGPAEIDVFRYPKQQKDNYALFRQACSQCHTLARPISSPRSSYWAWDYYVYTMRLRSQFNSKGLFTRPQAKRILDFLAYDSAVRKERHREAFEVLTKHLERKFDRMLGERIHRMQQGHPLLPQQSK